MLLPPRPEHRRCDYRHTRPLGGAVTGVIHIGGAAAALIGSLLCSPIKVHEAVRLVAHTHFKPATSSSRRKPRWPDISRILAIRRDCFTSSTFEPLELTITSAEIPLRSYIWTGLIVKKAYRWTRGVLAAANHPGHFAQDAQVSAATRTVKPWGCWCPRASGANLALPNGIHYCRRDRAVPSNVVCRLAPAPLRPRGQLFVDHVELGCCASTAAMIAGTIVNVMSASIGLSVPDSLFVRHRTHGPSRGAGCAIARGCLASRTSRFET